LKGFSSFFPFFYFIFFFGKWQILLFLSPSSAHNSWNLLRMPKSKTNRTKAILDSIHMVVIRHYSQIPRNTSHANRNFFHPWFMRLKAFVQAIAHFDHYAHTCTHTFMHMYYA
jgi:hypothetical protein